MATTRTTRASSPKKTIKSTKAAATKKLSVKKRATKPVSQKIDYYPNRMTLAISVLAGTLIVLLSLIAVLGSR